VSLLSDQGEEKITPRVEYRLTALGRSLLLFIAKIVEWGKRQPSRCHPSGRSLLDAIGVVPKCATTDKKNRSPW